MYVRFLIFLCVVGGLQGAKDSRNQTIECSFRTIDACFSYIPDLGGNFLASYAEKDTELNKTCLKKESFKDCMVTIPAACDYQNANGKIAIDSIVTFVNNKLCKNGSAEQNNFLNSSKCYNQNYSRRQNCVKKFASSKSDAKSLCCKSQKIQGCMMNDLKLCGKNSTDFQDRLITTYSGYTNILCTEYVKYCSGVAQNLLSVACLLLTIKVSLLNFIG